jgi:hypothetical protein
MGGFTGLVVRVPNPAIFGPFWPVEARTYPNRREESTTGDRIDFHACLSKPPFFAHAAIKRRLVNSQRVRSLKSVLANFPAVFARDGFAVTFCYLWITRSSVFSLAKTFE